MVAPYLDFWLLGLHSGSLTLRTGQNRSNYGNSKVISCKDDFQPIVFPELTICSLTRTPPTIFTGSLHWFLYSHLPARIPVWMAWTSDPSNPMAMRRCKKPPERFSRHLWAWQGQEPQKQWTICKFGSGEHWGLAEPSLSWWRWRVDSKAVKFVRVIFFGRIFLSRQVKISRSPNKSKKHVFSYHDD